MQTQEVDHRQEAAVPHQEIRSDENKPRFWKRKKKSKTKSSVGELSPSRYNTIRYFVRRNFGKGEKKEYEDQILKDPGSPCTIDSSSTTQSNFVECIKVTENPYNRTGGKTFEGIDSSVEVFMVMDENGTSESNQQFDEPYDNGRDPTSGHNLNDLNGTSSSRLTIDWNDVLTYLKEKELREGEEKKSQQEKTENVHSTALVRQQSSFSSSEESSSDSDDEYCMTEEYEEDSIDLDLVKVVSMDNIVRTLTSVNWFGDDLSSHEDNEFKDAQDDLSEDQSDEQSVMDDGSDASSLSSEDEVNTDEKSTGTSGHDDKPDTTRQQAAKGGGAENKAYDAVEVMMSESENTVAASNEYLKNEKDVQAKDPFLDNSEIEEALVVPNFLGSGKHEDEEGNGNKKDNERIPHSTQCSKYASSARKKMSDIFTRRTAKADGEAKKYMKTSHRIKKLVPIGKSKLFSRGKETKSKGNITEPPMAPPAMKMTLTIMDGSGADSTVAWSDSKVSQSDHRTIASPNEKDCDEVSIIISKKKPTIMISASKDEQSDHRATASRSNEKNCEEVAKISSKKVQAREADKDFATTFEHEEGFISSSSLSSFSDSESSDSDDETEILDLTKVVSMKNVMTFAEQNIRTLASVDWFGDDYSSHEGSESEWSQSSNSNIRRYDHSSHEGTDFEGNRSSNSTQVSTRREKRNSRRRAKNEHKAFKQAKNARRVKKLDLSVKSNQVSRGTYERIEDCHEKLTADTTDEIEVPTVRRKMKNVTPLTNWEQNVDGSLVGIITNPDNTMSARIKTSPVAKTAKAGEIITTSSGTKYLIA